MYVENLKYHLVAMFTGPGVCTYQDSGQNLNASLPLMLTVS